MYKKVINAIALNQIIKPVEVPDFHLMVGTAEDLESQPIVHYIDFIPKQTYDNLPNPEMTFEEVQQNLASGTLTIDDFFQNVYPLGEPIVKG